MVTKLPFAQRILCFHNPSSTIKDLFSKRLAQRLCLSSNSILSNSGSKTWSIRAITESDDIKEPPEIEYIVAGKKRKSAFIKKAEVKEFVSWEGLDSSEDKKFTDFSLDEILLERLASTGFKSTTPVQSLAIPEILSGADCALQSYTGSGKTLAYLLPVLTKAIERTREEWQDESIPMQEKGVLQALVVAPSQELAMQIIRVAETLVPEDSKTAVQQLIGGANFTRQSEALKTKPLIAVGTPGRLAEHSRKGTLLSHKCPILVLDEVDQLTKKQFQEDILRITEHTGKKVNQRQTILVSATLTPSLINRIGSWAPDAKFVFIGSNAAIQGTDQAIEQQKVPVPRWGWGNKWSGTFTQQNMPSAANASISIPPSIRHGYVVVEARKKIDSIRRAIHAMNSEKCLVFMNFAKRTQDVLFKLSARGMSVGSLHGNKSKLERVQTLQKFRNGKIRALVVSDVVSRGLDIADCDAVFNAELPTDASHYAHRAGRTGRMGRAGWVLSFIEHRELFVMEKLGRRLKIEIPRVEIRNGEVSLVQK